MNEHTEPTIILNGTTWQVQRESRFFLELASGRNRATIRKGDLWQVRRTNGEREIITSVSGTHPAVQGASVTDNGNIRVAA